MRELQQQFKNAVFIPSQYELEPNIQGHFSIYRNNIFITCIKKLKNIYPAVQRLIGEECFEGLAHEYILCTQTLLISRFPDFIVQYSPAKTLPYLSEVAQLEFACYDVLKKEIDTQRILSFHYPIFSIWNLCQSDDSNTAEIINLETGGESILITRRDFELYLEKI